MDGVKIEFENTRSCLLTRASRFTAAHLHLQSIVDACYNRGIKVYL